MLQQYMQDVPRKPRRLPTLALPTSGLCSAGHMYCVKVLQTLLPTLPHDSIRTVMAMAANAITATEMTCNSNKNNMSQQQRITCNSNKNNMSQQRK